EGFSKIIARVFLASARLCRFGPALTEPVRSRTSSISPELRSDSDTRSRPLIAPIPPPFAVPVPPPFIVPVPVPVPPFFIVAVPSSFIVPISSSSLPPCHPVLPPRPQATLPARLHPATTRVPAVPRRAAASRRAEVLTPAG